MKPTAIIRGFINESSQYFRKRLAMTPLQRWGAIIFTLIAAVLFNYQGSEINEWLCCLSLFGVIGLIFLFTDNSHLEPRFPVTKKQIAGLVIFGLGIFLWVKLANIFEANSIWILLPVIPITIGGSWFSDAK
jgi:hypothetical protein